MSLVETFMPTSNFGRGMILATVVGAGSAAISNDAQAAMITGNGTVAFSADITGAPNIQIGDIFDFDVDLGDNPQFVDLFPGDTTFGSYIINGVNATFEVGGEVLTIDDATITVSSGFNGNNFTGLLNFNAGNVQGTINGFDIDSVLVSTANVANDSAESVFNNLATGMFSINSDELLINGEIENAAFTPSSTAVPVPAAAWLFGTALVGLGVVSRNREI